MSRDDLEIKIDMLLDYKSFILTYGDDQAFDGGDTRYEMLAEIEDEIEFYLDKFIHNMNGIVPQFS